MAIPSNEEINNFLAKKIELWNKGEREALANLYREFAPKSVTFEYVGGPVLDAWQALDDMWEQFGDSIEMEIVVTLINGNEAACYIKNHHRDKPGNFTPTIETYVLGDGTLHERYFFPVPE